MGGAALKDRLSRSMEEKPRLLDEESIEAMYAESFSRALLAIREEFGLSQYQLGRITGIDKSYFSRLEKGERAPSRALVERLIVGLELASWEANRLRLAAGFAAIKRERLGGES